MASLISSLGAAAAISLAVAVLLWMGLSNKRFLTGSDPRLNRARAKEQFKAYRGNVAQEGGSISGDTASVFSETESFASVNYKVRNYTLTVLAKSPSGQHFLFKSNEAGRPYVKLLSEQESIRFLKDQQPQGEA
jgi:hypothetical protein